MGKNILINLNGFFENVNYNEHNALIGDSIAGTFTMIDVR